MKTGSLQWKKGFPVPCEKNFTRKTLFWPCSGPVRDCSEPNHSPKHLFFMWIVLMIVIWHLFFEIWVDVKNHLRLSHLYLLVIFLQKRGQVCVFNLSYVAVLLRSTNPWMALLTKAQKWLKEATNLALNYEALKNLLCAMLSLFC